MDNENNKEKFARAYAYHVHEDREDEAIEICKEILQDDPKDHFARMLLAIALADSAAPEEILMGREHFQLALKYCDDPNMIAHGWLEENPIYHLALWERRNRNETFAILLYIVDYLVFRTSTSREQALELASNLEPDQRETLHLVLNKVSEWIKR